MKSPRMRNGRNLCGWERQNATSQEPTDNLHLSPILQDPTEVQSRPDVAKEVGRAERLFMMVKRFFFANDCKSFRIPKLTSETVTEAETFQFQLFFIKLYKYYED
jgi:hypothetical protein